MLNMFRRSHVESDLAEQLEAHRAMIRADRMSRGMDAGQADVIAKRALGNEELVRELSRDELFHAWIDCIIRDTRYTLRGLRRAVCAERAADRVRRPVRLTRVHCGRANEGNRPGYGIGCSGLRSRGD